MFSYYALCVADPFTAISIKELATRSGLPRAKLRKALRALEHEQEMINTFDSVVEVCLSSLAVIRYRDWELTSQVPPRMRPRKCTSSRKMEIKLS